VGVLVHISYLAAVEVDSVCVLGAGELEAGVDEKNKVGGVCVCEKRELGPAGRPTQMALKGSSRSSSTCRSCNTTAGSRALKLFRRAASLTGTSTAKPRADTWIASQRTSSTICCKLTVKPSTAG